jgi:hypothetical protein
LPAEPLTAWLAASEQVGGLAVDFASLAVAAAWKDDVLEVQMPATAAAAVAFLSRPEMAAGIGRSLAEMAGRVAVVRLVTIAAPAGAPDAESAGRGAEAAPRANPAVSQTALVREATEHPFVARARTVFDAAIRRVDPPRRRAEVASVEGGGLTAAPVSRSASADDEKDCSVAVAGEDD